MCDLRREVSASKCSCFAGNARASEVSKLRVIRLFNHLILRCECDCIPLLFRNIMRSERLKDRYDDSNGDPGGREHLPGASFGSKTSLNDHQHYGWRVWMTCETYHIEYSVKRYGMPKSGSLWERRVSMSSLVKSRIVNVRKRGSSQKKVRMSSGAQVMGDGVNA